jgi:hypothetical protein
MAPASRTLTATFAANSYPLAIASAVFILAVGLPSTDSDTYWQLATGRWMLDHRELLHQDIFSSTVNGIRFGIGEWLGQLAFAAAFNVDGWAGIAILRAFLIALATFFLVRVARRGGVPGWISLPLVVATLLVSKITWTDRPHLFTLALFPLLLDFLFTMPAGASRRLLFIPVLFVVWANLHGGYLLGLAVLAVFAAHGLVTEGRRGVPLAVVSLAAAALTFVNPAPVELVGAARESVLHPPRILTEFLPPDVLSPAGAVFAAFMLGIIGTALLRGGTLLEAMLLIPLLYLALTAQRHMVFFCFAATVFLGPRLAGIVGARMPELRRAIVVPTSIALLIAAGASVATAPARPDESAYPSGALGALRDSSGVVLNEYDWGGYLIFRLPERPVFIDGRYYPYLDGVLDDYRALVGLRPGWRDLLDRYKVNEVFLMPQRPLVVALREDGWRVRAEDQAGRWVVLDRP